MALSKEDIRRLAELARLDLDESELDQRQGELERILEYVDRLANVDTTHVKEIEATSEDEMFRQDEPFPCDEATRQLILSNFPDRAGDALRVPAVFEKPKG